MITQKNKNRNKRPICSELVNKSGEADTRNKKSEKAKTITLSHPTNRPNQSSGMQQRNLFTLQHISGGVLLSVSNHFSVFVSIGGPRKSENQPLFRHSVLKLTANHSKKTLLLRASFTTFQRQYFFSAFHRNWKFVCVGHFSVIFIKKSHWKLSNDLIFRM